MIIVLFILFWASVITFGVYGLDKHFATFGIRRIPEVVLFFLAFFGGAAGALIGMCLFRHKTLHTYFWIINGIFFVLQILSATVFLWWLQIVLLNSPY